jgi:hypothetical protein
MGLVVGLGCRADGLSVVVLFKRRKLAVTRQLSVFGCPSAEA